jgi:phospholipid-binding lipoprotein MlaA
MKSMLPRFSGWLLLAALGALGGCATTGGNPKDPLEGINRAVFKFNDGLDKVVIKPVATGYKTVMPDIARVGVTNFFANLGDLWIGVNNVLQGKIGAGASDFGRFLMNSTFGILGVLDVASNAGLEKHNEDFGQTLGWWGVGAGAYVVLPVLGPSNVRDGLSTLTVDWRGYPLWYMNHISTRNELVGMRLVDARANVLDTTRLVEDAALDQYTFARDAYLQRRRSLIYDGDPPREPDPDATPQSGAEPRARAGAPQDTAQTVTQGGERMIAAASEERMPEKEFAEPRQESLATIRESAGAIARGDEPRIPVNRDAPLMGAGERGTEFTGIGLKP